MNVDGAIVMLDSCTKLHRCVSIIGWAHSDRGSLTQLDVEDHDIELKSSRVGLYHAGVGSLGPNKGFEIQIIMKDSNFPCSASLVFYIGSTPIKLQLADLLAEAQARQMASLSKTFFEQANLPEVKTILDVGGRARSQVDRSQAFRNKDVTVLDVLPGSNVTVVGDAHEMSSFLPHAHYDAFLSVSVFEHLLMPWKVAIELNHVLKPGGFGLVHTHQTLGMHDMPWDFWRFSDTSWDALFNASTGFEIVERALTHPSFILPYIYRDDKACAERALGFEGSSVIVRKIGSPKVSWDVRPAEIISTNYPSS